MLACFVPMDAYAIVGSVRSETEEVTNNKGTYRNYNVTWIENDHIRLYFVQSSKIKFWRWLSGNCAARTKASAKEAYDMVFNKKIYQVSIFCRKFRKNICFQQEL